MLIQNTVQSKAQCMFSWKQLRSLETRGLPICQLEWRTCSSKAFHWFFPTSLFKWRQKKWMKYPSLDVFVRPLHFASSPVVNIQQQKAWSRHEAHVSHDQCWIWGVWLLIFSTDHVTHAFHVTWKSGGSLNMVNFQNSSFSLAHVCM